MHLTKSIAAGLLTVASCMADITGTIKDIHGVGISGVAVNLEKGGQAAISGTGGQFNLSTGLDVKNGWGDSGSIHFIRINNGSMSFNITRKSDVQLEAFTIAGEMIFKKQVLLNAGNQSIRLRPYKGICIYKLLIDNEVFYTKYISVNESISLLPDFYQKQTSGNLGKRAAIVNDVLIAKKDGYLDYQIIITNSDTSGIQVTMLPNEGNLTDASGNVYQTVKIGSKIWTVQNLKTSKYNDGSTIPVVTDARQWDDCYDTEKGACCFYNNTTNADSIKKFGALYNWYAVNTSKLAPAGWHVATPADWDSLEYEIRHVHNPDGSVSIRDTIKPAAARTDWTTITDPYLGYAIGYAQSLNNSSGFSALPGGYRGDLAEFRNVGTEGRFWTSDEDVTSFAVSRTIQYDNNHFVPAVIFKWYGCSVRLVKD